MTSPYAPLSARALLASAIVLAASSAASLSPDETTCLAETPTYPTPGTPSTWVFADVNGDGILDAVTLEVRIDSFREQMSQLDIRKYNPLPNWNYTIAPS